MNFYTKPNLFNNQQQTSYLRFKHTMMQLFFVMLWLLFFTMNLSAQISVHGTIKVHPNKHFLQYQDGTPFFYLGDTAWELFHRLNLFEARVYLTDRAWQGYNVIQAVILAELDGLRTPNANGDLPFTDELYTQPNEAYFKHIDDIIQLMDSLGMVAGLLPSWGDKINKAWGEGPVIFDNDQKAEDYGRFLGNRYKNHKNIIWILGGDRDYTGYESIIRAMAKGIAIGISGNEDYNQCLMTLHPNGGGSSAKWFHNDEWLDFNMQQNGHCYDVDVWKRIQQDYNLIPTKPIMDGEPLYEEHPVCFDKNQHGTSMDFQVRRFFYHEVFAGAFGHSYGCHAIWQMWTPEREPINGPIRPWYASILLSGTYQMGYGRALMESRPFFTRIPDQSIIIEGQQGEKTKLISATRDKYGSYAMIYSEQGEPFAANLLLLSGEKIIASWFDVRNGKSIKIGTFKKTPNQWFYPPSKGKGNDWVLVLDDASQSFPLPETYVQSIIRNF